MGTAQGVLYFDDRGLTDGRQPRPHHPCVRGDLVGDDLDRLGTCHRDRCANLGERGAGLCGEGSSASNVGTSKVTEFL